MVSFLCTSSKASLESMDTYLNCKSAWRISERSINSPCIILCCSFRGMLGIILAMVAMSVAMLVALVVACEMPGSGPMARRVTRPSLMLL